MPFAVNRTGTDLYLTRRGTWEDATEDPDCVRMYTTAGAAANSVRQLYAPKVGEPYEVDIVEIEWRVTAIKTRWSVSNDGRYAYKSQLTRVTIPKAPARSTFRHA